MLSQQQIQQLKSNQQSVMLEYRIERYQYLGILKEYQLHPPSIVNSLDYTKLNQYQVFLFKRVLHGMNAYKAEEISTMHWDKKRRIKKVWKRGQNVINRMKQRLTNKRANKLLNDSVWAHTSVIKQLTIIPIDITDDSLINRMSLKDLGIQYEDLIIKFYYEGLLPKNYFELK